MRQPHQSFTRAKTFIHFVCAAMFAASSLNAAPGDSHWDRQFGLPGVTNRVLALRFNGDKLYASGYAVGTDGLLSTNTGVDIFDGTNWSSTIGELTDPSLCVVYDVVVIGSNTYVGGTFTKAGGVTAVGLAKWDGAEWSDVGGLSSAIYSLASDGTNLYASGIFTNAGGVLMTNFGRWDGTSWSAVGGASVGSSTLEWNQGRLYLAGSFTNVGSVAATNLAVWDGSSWSQFGGGVNGSVAAMAFDGDNLFIGGKFTSAGGVAAQGIAKWDGNSWSPLGSGAKAPPNSTAVTCIGILGTEVCIGGGFTNVGGTVARSFAKWDGFMWTTYPITDGVFQFPLNDAASRMLVKDGSLYIGGTFNQAGGVIADHVVRYDGNNFYALGEKPANGFITPAITVNCIGQADDGVYVGGLFTAAGKTPANRIARWDGTNWNALGNGTEGGSGSANQVFAIASRGNDVFVGGRFTGAGGLTSSNIVKWDGANWSALGGGVSSNVSAIATTANDVYVGGSFTLAYDFFTLTVNRIARWDGFAWNSLGSGVNGNVNDIAVNSNGNVYIGGTFTLANGSVTANRIAMWDGSAWSSLGAGSSNGVNGTVQSIVINGTDVYVGGSFTNAGNMVVRGIAKWDGANWSGFGSGATGPSGTDIRALAFGEDARLYCTGRFTNISGVKANGIARWNGTTWEALGSGFFADLQVVRGVGLAIRGDDVYAVGTFTGAGLSESGGIARWNETMDFTPTYTMNFSRTQLLPGNMFKSRITTSERVTYVMEYSDDFQNWIPLKTNIATQLDFTNAVSLPVNRRVFRTRGIP